MVKIAQEHPTGLAGKLKILALELRDGLLYSLQESSDAGGTETSPSLKRSPYFVGKGAMSKAIVIKNVIK